MPDGIRGNNGGNKLSESEGTGAKAAEFQGAKAGRVNREAGAPPMAASVRRAIHQPWASGWARVRALMLRTERGPLRPVWGLVHQVLARGVAAYLRRGDARLSVYLRGSLAAGDPVYGFADIDLAFVIPRQSRGERQRIELRWRRLRRRLPTGLRGLFEVLQIYREHDLSAWTRSTPFTQACRSAHVWPTSRERERERRGAERSLVPELAGEWRLLAGPERRPTRPPWNAQHRRIVAWLELQYWWLLCFRTCADPDAVSTRYMCVKLLTEPARVWLWLVCGERIPERRALIRRALREMPEETASLELALRLLDSLDRSAGAPLPTAVSSLVRVSHKIARKLDEDVAQAGFTEVRLVRRGEEGLAAQASSLARVRRALGGHASGSPLPLVDWRARVWSFPPDECFLPVLGAGTDPMLIASAAVSAGRGAYAGFVLDGLLVLPSLRDARLRGVQSPATDPVSFALVEGASTAAFPNVDGWSVHDCARRAVAEHLGWLRAGGHREDRIDELGKLFSAARAALFHASAAEGHPALQITAAATADCLAEVVPERATAVLRAYDAYLAAREDGTAPDQKVTESLREVVSGLPVYLWNGMKKSRG